MPERDDRIRQEIARAREMGLPLGKFQVDDIEELLPKPVAAVPERQTVTVEGITHQKQSDGTYRFWSDEMPSLPYEEGELVPFLDALLASEQRRGQAETDVRWLLEIVRDLVRDLKFPMTILRDCNEIESRYPKEETP